jgi:hypothetical protein
MSSDDLVIEKIPLNRMDKIFSEPSFQYMPIMYLELLENKTKIKKEYINKFYVPESYSRPPSVQKERTFRETTDPLPSHSYNQFGSENDKDASISGDDTESADAQVNDPTQSLIHSLLGKDDPTHSSQHQPPSLQELQDKKKITVPREYVYGEEDEETQKERNALYFKYEVLKRMHPNASIPEFNNYSDPKTMSQKYDILTKRLSLDSSVENWKRYMIIFVMGCEVGLGKINFDMEGFAQQQITSMSTYEQLLVELAEKSYVPTGVTKWSPEIRLFMMLTMNLIIFIISKSIFKKTGANILGSFNEKMKEPDV